MDMDYIRPKQTHEFVIYANTREDIDVCVKCFGKLSVGVVTKLGLDGYHTWQERGHTASRITCDICQTKQRQETTKLDIAIKLKMRD